MKRFLLLTLGMILVAGVMGYSPPPTVNTDDCHVSVTIDVEDQDLALEAFYFDSSVELHDTGPPILVSNYYTITSIKNTTWNFETLDFNYRYKPGPIYLAGMEVKEVESNYGYIGDINHATVS